MMQRLLVSGGWWFVALVYFIFFVFASCTLHNLHRIRSVERDQRGIENALVVQIVAACAEGAAFLVLSAFSLLGRWCSHDTAVGLWYAVTVALALCLSAGFLPVAVLLQGYVQVARLWEKSDVWLLKNTIELQGAAGSAYLLLAAAAAYAAILLFCKRAFAEQQEEARRQRAQARRRRGGGGAPYSEAASEPPPRPPPAHGS